MTTQEVLDLISTLRAKGVVQFSANGISLVLGPEPVPHSTQVMPEEPGVKFEVKLGKDGLDAEAQAELYGRAFTDTRE